MHDSFEEICSWADDAEDAKKSTQPGQNGHYARPDQSQNADWLEAFIARNGLTITRRELQNGTLKLILSECPFNPSHKGSSAALFVNADGKYGFKCQHDSCLGKTWHAVRQHFEPLGTTQQHQTEQRSEPENDDIRAAGRAEG